MSVKFDFGGYATKNDLKCADGRTIRKNAFKDCDGITVPLVWMHEHDDPSKVLGHALLENRDDGVYAYASFNDTEAGQKAKKLVQHKDIKSMSIYANKLIQKGSDVIHGVIREVSLVLAGANPGAMICDVSFEHFDEGEDAEFEAWIHNDENIVLAHSEPMPAQLPADAIAHANAAPAPTAQREPKMSEIYDSMTPEQQNLLLYCVDRALKEGENEPDESTEEEKDMSHNLFENNGAQNNDVLIHDALNTVLADGKKYGSLKESYNHHMQEGVLAHIDTTGMETSTGNQTYFVNDPNFLFPEARALNNPPEFIKRDMDWVDVVLRDTHHTPFSRIKSVFADITEDEARAKGYAKGKRKIEEVFTLLKRTTTPTTIYKKQKIDRDDQLDITDFDVVAWIKREMRMMLNEEIARAILIGDGRNPSSNDKINEQNVRPIVSEDPLFNVQATFVTDPSDDNKTAKNFIRAAIRARKDYKGSGNPTLFTTEDMLTILLLLEDGLGHAMYKSEAELATALRVKRIVTVPVMEEQTLANGNTLGGIIVNLTDYNVGADKGGEINMFDDFDIDYNQQKYLIETRISGALIKPFSAITLSSPAASSSNP